MTPAAAGASLARMLDRVTLPPALRRELEERCAARYPREACGFLFGRVRDACVELVALREGTNVAREPRTRFTLEPLELLLAEREAHARGLALVGLWHSHPDRPAMPSPEDRAGLTGTGLQLIVALQAGRVHELQAWELARDRPRALVLTLADDADRAADSADRRACRAGRP